MKILAASCAGLALWCSLGAIAVTGPDIQTRLGLLPPWWSLPLACALFYLTLRAARFSTAQSLPLFGSALMLLPWLPVRVPTTFLLWTGPLVIPVWAVIFGALVWSRGLEPISAWLRSLQLASAWFRNGASGPLLAFVLALAAYGLSAWWLAPLMPDGDAPHYLIIAQSIVNDGDIQIEDNHRRGDYLAYSLHASQPDFLRRGVNGAIYSIHAPGLAVIIAPAMWLLGYPGVVAFLGTIGAASTALVWWLSFRGIGSAIAAWIGWAAGTLTVPFFFQATQVFPDGLAAGLLLIGVLPLMLDDAADVSTKSPASDSRRFDSSSGPPVIWWVAGLSLAILPWLQTRLAILSLTAATCLLARRLRKRALLSIFLTPAVSAVAWFTFFYVVYGTPNPAAPYGSYTQTAVANVGRGLTGILFDQQFGLLPNAPIYAVVIAGLLVGAVRRRRWSWECLILAVPYTVAVGMYEHWWGGASVAARFLTPLSLVSAVAAARVWHEARSTSTRLMFLLALVFSIYVTGVLLFGADGRLLINFRDGVALWTEWVNRSLALPRALPSLFVDTPGAALFKAAVWAASAAGVWFGWYLLERFRAARSVRLQADERSPAEAGHYIHLEVARERRLDPAGSRGNDGQGVIGAASIAPGARGSVSALRAAVVLVVGSMIALTATWQIGGASPLTPARAQVGLLAAAASWRPVGFDFAARAVVPASDVRARLRVRSDDLRARADRTVLLTARAVPAGDYRLDAISTKAAAGTLAVRVGDINLQLRRFDAGQLSPRGEVQHLHLPIDVQSLVVVGDAAAVGSVDRVELAPAPSGDVSLGRPTARSARRAAGYAAGDVFFQDDDAFPEPTGFWVAGGRSAEMVMSSAESSLTLFLRNAPIGNLVIVEVDGQRQEVRLDPGEEQRITFSATRADASVRIAAQAGFRPSEHEVGNKDFRYLGVWVELAESR